MRFDVKVEVSLREGIADPAGATIERSLPALGFEGVTDVRMGKAIRFQIDAPDEPTARDLVESMCERFLTNPVIEDSTTVLLSPLTTSVPNGTLRGPEEPKLGGVGQ